MQVCYNQLNRVDSHRKQFTIFKLTRKVEAAVFFEVLDIKWQIQENKLPGISPGWIGFFSKYIDGFIQCILNCINEAVLSFPI